MTDYYGTMLDYLESYRLDLYTKLIEKGEIRQWLEDHLKALGEAEDTVAKAFASKHPELSETQIRLQAQEAAIALVLPVPDEAEHSDA